MVTFLTEKEFEIFNNSEFLINKREVTKKLIVKLQETERLIKELIISSQFTFPNGTLVKSGKISKGENYRSLPYLVLDYPRLFKNQTAFAYRNMIWWGMEISATLHIQGNALQPFLPWIEQNKKKLDNHFICINDSPWEYHFESDNYALISNLNDSEFKKLLHHNKDFIKISRKWPLETIENLPDSSSDNLRYLLNCISY